MRPVIGIPLRYQKLIDNRAIVYMSERMRRTIQVAGGFVYPICPVQDVDYFYTKGNEFLELNDDEKELIEKSVCACDGIIFPGGVKFTPYDRYLLEVAVQKKIPVLGICLGMQMMSCFQEELDLKDVSDCDKHYQESDFEFSHTIKIDKNSKLYKIIGKSEIFVNSFHKRCVSENGIYRTVAISDDGIIEAIEYPGDYFSIGVQWHPEISYEFDENSRKLIDAFIKECSIQR